MQGFRGERELVEVCFADFPSKAAFVLGMVYLAAELYVSEPKRVGHPVWVVFVQPLYEFVQICLAVWQVGGVPVVHCGNFFSVGIGSECMSAEQQLLCLQRSLLVVARNATYASRKQGTQITGPYDILHKEARIYTFGQVVQISSRSLSLPAFIQKFMPNSMMQHCGGVYKVLDKSTHKLARSRDTCSPEPAEAKALYKASWTVTGQTVAFDDEMEKSIPASKATS